MRVDAKAMYVAVKNAANAARASRNELANVLYIQKEEKRLVISGYSADMTVSTSVPVTGDASIWKVEMEAKKILAVLSALNEEVSFEKNDTCLVVKAEGKKVTFPYKGNVTFDTPSDTFEDFAKVSDVAELAEQCKHATSDGDTNPLMNSLYIESDGKDVQITALDGFRVARRGSSNLLNVTKKVPVLAKSFTEALRMGEGGTIKIGDKYILVENSTTRILVPTIAGDYFKISAIVGQDTGKKFTVSKEDLLEAVGMAEIFNEKVKFTFSKDSVKLTTISEAVDLDIPINNSEVADGFTIGFTSQYLREMAKSLDGDELTIEITTPKKPIKAWGANEGIDWEIVLPVNLTV